jgi:flavin-dependent dehydrogenase
VRAKETGVEVLEGTTVTRIEGDGERIERAAARTDDGRMLEVDAEIFIDATGRVGALSKLVEKRDGMRPTGSGKPAFVGFKAHIAGAEVDRGACEIYSFPGGYAGLSNVEGDLANLCFLVRSETVRSISGGAEEIVGNVVVRNKRAAATLKDFAPANEWLAVSINGFGTKRLAPAANLFTIGDAASFIDPFTGSGMVMALESADVLASAVNANRTTPDRIAGEYLQTYRRRFGRRLRLCSVLRRTAFMPRLATAVVVSLGVSSAAQRLLARATRR